MANAAALPFPSPQEQRFAQQNAADIGAKRERVGPIAAAGRTALQTAAALRGMTGDDQMTNRQLRRQARKMMKAYKLKMKFLDHDISAEEKGIGSTFFYPAGLALYGLTDIISVFDLGTFTTILNWIVYVVTAVIVIIRIWNYATIRYSDPKRAVRRVKKMAQKATLRVIRRLLISLLEAIPFVGMLPIWSFAHNLEKWFERRHKMKLQGLRRRVRVVERRMRLLERRARVPRAQFVVAQMSLAAVGDLERRFDAI